MRPNKAMSIMIKLFVCRVDAQPWEHATKEVWVFSGSQNAEADIADVSDRY